LNKVSCGPKLAALQLPEQPSFLTSPEVSCLQDVSLANPASLSQLLPVRLTTQPKTSQKKVGKEKAKNR